jgi:hypothetical protein
LFSRAKSWWDKLIEISANLLKFFWLNSKIFFCAWELKKNRKNDVPPVRKLSDQRSPQEIQVNDLIPDQHLQADKKHRLLRFPRGLQD